MKKHTMISLFASARPAILAMACVFACAVVPAPPARAGVIITESNRILLGEGQASLVWSGTDNHFQIADGVTLTVTRFGIHSSSPGYATILPGTHVIYEPLDTTGQVIFDGIRASGIGGVFTLGANSRLEVTNGIFRNNRGGNITSNTAISSQNGDGVSGVIQAQVATAYVGLKNVVFENNGQLGNTGVMRISGSLVMEGGAMIGNYASGDHSGAINMNGTPYISFTDVLFDGNRARTIGGAITAGSGTLLLNNVIFNNNWAGGQGGALRANPDANSVLKFNMTDSGGTTSYMYKGNFALNRSKQEIVVSDTQVIDNAPGYAPDAKGGGFLHNSTSNTTIEFAVADGVGLHIGDPDETNKAYDSLTTNGAAPKIVKTGGGDLVLNADSAYWKGSSTVSAGRMLLGNDGAVLGGTVVVQSGAAFGGAGLVATTNYATDLPDAATVNVRAGGVLQVGLADRKTDGLVVLGSLNLDNATIAFTAFGGTHAATLGISSTTSGSVTVTGAINVSGTNIVNMQGFTQNGVYNLGYIYDALSANGEDSLLYAVNGRVTTPSQSTRQSAQRSESYDGSLQVQVSLDTARRMRWTGTDGADPTVWDDYSSNWAGVSAASADVTQYAALDTVYFDAPGAITINGGVPVSGMETEIASGSLVFGGHGGITSAPWDSVADAEDYVRAATGKLVKTGAGKLVLNNDGVNVFHGGVEIHGGAIEIQRGEQLQTAAASLVFVNDATLRVTSSGTTIMQNAISIGAGKTATVEVVPTSTGAPVIFEGSLTGGKLLKTGSGALMLAGVNSHETTELREGTLGLAHDEALGSGRLLVQGNNRAVTVSANVTIKNDIEFGENNLLLYNLSVAPGGARTATIAGSLRGKSLTIIGDVSDAGHTRGTLKLAGSNTLESITIRDRATLEAASAGALGGGATNIVVNSGGALHLSTTDVTAGDVLVESGGIIGFNRPTRQMLVLSGSFTIESSSTVAILSRLTSGFSKLIHAEGGISYDPYSTEVVDLGNNNNSSFIVYTDDDNNLMLMNMNRAGNPGKDIAVSLDAMTASVSAIYTRMSESFLLMLDDYAPGASPSRSVWVKGIGSFGDYDGDASRIGYTDTTYGFAYGFDMVLSERFLLGFYGGYTDSKLKADNHAETNADMPHLGIYGAVKLKNLYFAADVFGGAVKASTVRTEDNVTGRYKAAVYGASAETGFVFRTWENGHFKPSVGLHWMYFDYRDQSEIGTGAIFIDDFSTDRLESVVGAQLTHSFVTAWKKPATLSLQAGWRSSLQNERTKLNVRYADMYVYDDNFEVLSDEYSRDRISIGVGLGTALGERSSLSLAYECEVAKDHTRHNVNATLRWLW